jgi:cytochrome P450
MLLFQVLLFFVFPLALVQFSLYLLRVWNRSKLIRQKRCQPPPTASQNGLLLGLDSVFRSLRMVKENKLNLSTQQQLQKYGYTFQSKSLAKTRFFTIEPENLQAIFAKDFESWGSQPFRLFPFQPFVGKGIMCTDGAFWAHSRALIKPTFARTQISDLSALNVHVDRLIRLIPTDGSTVDLQPLFGRLALDSSTEFLFGESVNTLLPHATEDAAAFLDAYNYGQAILGKRMQLPHWNFLTRDKRFWESCKVAHQFVDQYVDKALQQKDDGVPTKRYVLAYELAKETKDRTDIRNQLLNIFLPAHDATAVILTNIFFHLARHASVWNKLRQELDAHGLLTGGASMITLERLKSIKYLQYIMNETFRLNPTIGILSRAALRDTTLPVGGGADGSAPIFVKKGDVLSASLYAMHRRKDIYGEDAHVFRPARWESLRPRFWSYLPFGGGPRVCPAQQFALAEVGFTIVRFAQTYVSIENKDPVHEFVESYKISTESKNGAKVAFALA